MRAAITPSYGPAHVLQLRDVPTPTLGAREVLVAVHATPVTAGDLRLRAADFPTFSVVPGRLMLGVRRPRRAIQGTMFAGRVVEVGRSVTRYAVGDDVFGSAFDGAYAEYLSMPEDGAMANLPPNVSYDEAAAVPYGAVTALRFLRELGSVAPGDQVLVVGAAGGVGRFAVQLAKHLGAEVTGVASRRNLDLVRRLGADHVIDHETEDFTKSNRRYDVVFDAAGVTTFGGCRSSLTRSGRYLTLFGSVRVLIQMAMTAIFGGRKVKFTVAIGARDDLEEVRDLLARDLIRPVIARRFPLERIAEAHAEAESGRAQGSVIVTVAARPHASTPREPVDSTRSATA
jgi:NADPH:quinone reductase-like Zn-dependent oxidoreductase